MEHLPHTAAPPSPKLVQTIVPTPSPNGCKPLRVASYCRTSTNMECQYTSIEAQRVHYRNLILSHPNWELVDIYWEVGVSATKAETRPELQRLISDCRAGRRHRMARKLGAKHPAQREVLRQPAHAKAVYR